MESTDEMARVSPTSRRSVERGLNLPQPAPMDRGNGVVAGESLPAMVPSKAQVSLTESAVVEAEAKARVAVAEALEAEAKAKAKAAVAKAEAKAKAAVARRTLRLVLPRPRQRPRSGWRPPRRSRLTSRS